MVTNAVLAVAQKLMAEGAWSVRTAIIMADHVHLLIALGAQMELAAVMRLFKGRTAPALRASGMRWQRGYFDHRLRAGEDRLPVFRYLYLNPYRAGLIQMNEKWPGYFCAMDEWAWFASMTNQDCPLPEWLM